MKKSKVTVGDIAAALNISRVTVSKTLHDRDGVSTETRRLIIQKAIEMGFPITQLNKDLLRKYTSAEVDLGEYSQMLSSGAEEDGSHSITNVAVAVSRPESSIFWLSIIHNAARIFTEHRINLIYTYLPPTLDDNGSLPVSLLDGSIQGLVVLNIYDANLLRALNELPVEKIFLDCCPDINFNELSGDLFLLEGRSNVGAIVQHIIEKGKKRIGFIGDIGYAQTNKERYLGYKEAMERNNLPIDPELCLTSSLGIEREYYEAAVADFITSHASSLDAIVCASDFLASLVIKQLISMGLRVPQDLYVTGYDDNPEFNNYVPITTVHVKNMELGIRLASQLIFRLEQPNTDHEIVYIRNKTIFRTSTGD